MNETSLENGKYGSSYQCFLQQDVQLRMALTLCDLGGRLSVPIGCVQRSLNTWTLQQEAGDAPESILGSKVEERWSVCASEL